MGFANKIQSDKGSLPDQAARENAIRAWIASREGVCPYAPGIAKFTHLPFNLQLDMDSVRYAAEELSAFYCARDKKRKVLRWMLVPPSDWQTHEEAKEYSEAIYWLFAAAYFYLKKDRKRTEAAMNRQLSGINTGLNDEILNPIVGELAKSSTAAPSPKSLFCTALGPSYQSKKFYRYAPHSIMVMVYAKDFMKKKRHVDVVNQITHEMIRGNLIELWGEKAEVCLGSIGKEMPLWERIIEASLRNFATTPVDMNSMCSVLSTFRALDATKVNAVCHQNFEHLPVLNCIATNTGQSYFTLLNSMYSGSGLYVVPKRPF